MKISSLVAALIAVLLLAGVAAADYDQLIKRVDEAWSKRSADTAPMIEAVKLAEQAYGEKPGFDAAWRAARACFWICDRTEVKKVDIKYGTRGSEWGQKAIKADPNAVEGYYWYGCCFGEYGKGLSIVTALAKGLAPKFEKAANKAIAINADYDNAGPYRLIGRYYFKLPWPKYAPEKAEANLLAGLKSAPKQARTYVYLAEVYIKEKQYDKARSVLANLAALDTGYPDDNFDHIFYKRMGKDMTEQIEGK